MSTQLHLIISIQNLNKIIDNFYSIRKFSLIKINNMCQHNVV